ncbi:MAG TPA: hypothetical protein PLI98_12940 [Candidatus Hydrogenedentes bacterium]|nr:hypothetical protein [Candidatus Hydrogenedentota bacterium]
MDQKPLIPRWAWTVLSAAVLAAVVALFLTGKPKEPGPSFRHDTSNFEKAGAAQKRFRETARFALDLANPTGLAAAADGGLLVCGENTVLVLDAAGKETARHAVAGTPECVAQGPDGRIYLGMRRRVVVLDAAGTVAAEWPEGDERAYLTSIAADTDCVYAADAGNRVVLRHGLDGALLGEIGRRDAAREIPGFVVPSPHLEVALDPMTGLWANNPGRHGLEQYRPDGSLASSWYRAGMTIEGFCGCCNPMAVAFRADGSVVTAEKGLVRIKVTAPDLSLAGVVALPEDLGAASGEAAAAEDNAPVRDLAVDAQGRILALHGPWKAVLVYEEEQHAAG